MIWLASFPKSGNTWMRALLSNLLASGNEPQNINELLLRGPIASARDELDERAMVDSSLLRADEIRRLRPAVHDRMAAETQQSSRGELFLKTHDAFTLLEDGIPLLGRSARAALYLIRDPRDIAVSFAEFIGGDINEALALINDPKSCLSTNHVFHLEQELNGWSGHVRSWTTQTVIPVHVVRYEDLLSDTAGVFARALAFLDMAVDDARVAKAVQHAAFTALQQQERAHGFREKPAMAAAFFREGRAGVWRERLDPAHVTAIEAAHSGAMTQFGYL